VLASAYMHDTHKVPVVNVASASWFLQTVLMPNGPQIRVQPMSIIEHIPDTRKFDTCAMSDSRDLREFYSQHDLLVT
jgi:hypothetical protein